MSRCDRRPVLFPVRSSCVTCCTYVCSYMRECEDGSATGAFPNAAPEAVGALRDGEAARPGEGEAGRKLLLAQRRKSIHGVGLLLVPASPLGGARGGECGDHASLACAL